MMANGTLLVIVGGNGYYKKPPELIVGLFESSQANYKILNFYEFILQTHSAMSEARFVIDCTYGLYGQVQRFADLMGLTVIGNPYMAASLYDKIQLKSFLTHNNIPTPPYITWSSDIGDFGDLEDVVSNLLGDVVVIKPARKDTLSDGINLWERGQSELKALLNRTFKVDSEALLEAFIGGTEYCVGFVPKDGGLMSLPIAQLQKKSPLFDHTAKTSGDFKFDFPLIGREIELEAAGIGHLFFHNYSLCEPFYINFFIHCGRVCVFDLGTRVGLSAKSYFPNACLKAGLDPYVYLGELFNDLVNEALISGEQFHGSSAS